MGEGTANRSNQEWLDSVYDKLKVKLKAECRRVGTDIPYTTGEDGRYRDIIDTAYGRTPDGGVTLANWTNGFWPGMLWQMYHATGDTAYRDAAAGVEERLEVVLKDSEAVGHDLGFLFLQSSVANYRETGDKEAKRRGLLAAAELAARYNLKGEFLRAWSGPRETEHGKRMGGGDIRGWMIIDSMMNLPLLYWASEETGDPRFSQIAENHAHTAAQHFVRGDGSVNHIVEFDTHTGEYVTTYGGQGYETGSSWTRGQAWGLYGFTLSYLHTKNPEFLSAAERIANYFMANIPESGLIPVDFRQPTEPAWEDSTAAAIAACGLIELSKLSDGRQSDVYLSAAVKLLQALEKHSFNWNEDEDNFLTKCTGAYHDKEHEFSIIYGDYYFLEALMKLCSKELVIW